MNAKVEGNDASKGFTLLEVLLAAAIFGLSAYMLALSFNNGQMALLNWEESSEVEKVYNWAIKKIDLKQLNLDELEKGGDFTSVEGYRVEWVCEVIPTETLDLFVAEYYVTIVDGARVLKEFRDKRLFFHDQWYEDDDREKLVEEKEKHFERMAQERKFQ